MTKKQITAVKKTIKMWEWLKLNPTKDKDGYLEMKGVKEDNIPLN